MSESRSRAGGFAGALAPVVLATTIAVGWVVSPEFAWPTDPFSVIGGGDGVVALAFNAGLVVAGACWLGFATVVREERASAVGVLTGVVGLGFVLAGSFPIPHLVHAIGGALVLFGIPLLLAVDAVTYWRSGRSRPTIALAAGAVGTVAVWLPYDLGLTALQPGYAVLELVAFGGLAAWSAWTTRRVSSMVTETAPAGNSTT